MHFLPSCHICHFTYLEIALMGFGYRFEMEDKWKVLVFYFKEYVPSCLFLHVQRGNK